MKQGAHDVRMEREAPLSGSEPDWTEIREETLNLQVLKDYVGGRGLGMYYLLRRVTFPNFSGISKKEVRGKKSMQNFQFTI